MWFQAAECNAVNASLLLNLINNNFLIFLTENLPILNPFLPPKSENLRPILVNLLKMRPHHSHSSHENATPSGTSPLASCKGVPPPGISWNILARAKPHNSANRRCNLCLLEKFIVIRQPERSTLNKRNELVSLCRHRNKALLRYN